MRSRFTFLLALLLACSTVMPAVAGDRAGNPNAAGSGKKHERVAREQAAPRSAQGAQTGLLTAEEAARKDRQRPIETGVIKEFTPAEPTGALLYNVIFKTSVKDPKAAALDLAKAQGFKPTHVYRNLFKGFAGKMTPEQARKVAKDPKVVSVEAARKVFLDAQVTPLGITRIQATSNPLAKIDGIDERVDADVMVIDELVDYHPDLNVVSRADCVDGSVSGNELGIGHGTHVAGTIAAIDNGTGVVGVAPGARIWSVNVFQNGGAYDSWIACALDAAAAAKVDVANMSLGGAATYESACGGRDVMHNAVCRAVAAGVTVVVAAGNSAKDSKGYVPAQYDEVITVSALNDTDGTSAGDALASFSNYGADVDIAAPGVSVRSTMPGNTLGTMSGTSMASPHVAGAAALYLAQNPGATPAQVKAALQANRDQIALIGDKDGIDEGVLNVRNLNGSGPTPTPSPTATTTATPSPSPTATPSPSPTATATATPSPTATATPGPDTTAPSVTLTSPTSSVQQTFTMKADAADASGIARVEFWYCVSGACAKIGSDSTAPYSINVKGSAGVYELYAVAYDKAGNRGESAHRTITVSKSGTVRNAPAKDRGGKNAKAGKASVESGKQVITIVKHGKK